jgi:hypothetical protein
MPYTSEQNGIAERKNRTLKEFARSILMDSELGIEYSMDAMVFATFIRNRSPRKKPGKTAIDLITGKRTSFKYIHAFGTTCYVTIAKEERRRKGLKSPQPMTFQAMSSLTFFSLNDMRVAFAFMHASQSVYE